MDEQLRWRNVRFLLHLPALMRTETAPFNPFKGPLFQYSVYLSSDLYAVKGEQDASLYITRETASPLLTLPFTLSET